jgi:hypothetical protein
VLWCINLFRKAKSETEKIRYNLTVNIQCYKKSFEDNFLHIAEDEIEAYGLAINRAKKILKGDWRVTERGYLMRGFATDEGIKNHVATIYIDDAVPGILLLERALAGKEQLNENSCRVHMHFEDSGGVVNVSVDENGMFLF